MRYHIREKVWSLGEQFTIKDDAENDVFFAKGAIFGFGDDLSFQDASGQELVRIKQKVLSFRTTYEISEGGQFMAEIRKEFSMFKDNYTIDVPGPNDYTVKGNFFGYEFEFERSGRHVAQVSKKFALWSDAYSVDIVDGEDDILILATAIVIDLVIQDRRD